MGMVGGSWWTRGVYFVGGAAICASCSRPPEIPHTPTLNDRQIQCVYAVLFVDDVDFFKLCDIPREEAGAVASLLAGYLMSYQRAKDLERLKEFERFRQENAPLMDGTGDFQ